MRHLIWYLRSAFCKHDWDLEEEFAQERDAYDGIKKQGDKVSATCKKCGWHRNYWKFL